MAFFTSPDGVRLHYEIEGHGPPLVLHLGAGADSELWRAAGYVDALAKRHRCILFDHRGHGPSDHPSSPEANTIDRYAADVLGLVDHLGLGRVDVFGWSNGLTVALKAADQRRELFDHLILFGGMAPPATHDQIVARTEERLRGMRARGWRYILDDMVAAEPLPVPQWFLDRVMATDTGPWLAYTEARPLWNWDPWDALPRIGRPTLIIVGALEDPDDMMAEVAVAMPQATRIRVPDREHINAFLDSSFSVPLIEDFLASDFGP